MIAFDLACARGHVFEGWFGTSEDYETQRANGLVACPICSSVEVSKALMAPNVGTKSNSRAPVPAASAGELGPAGEIKPLLARLAQLQRALVAQSEDVGARFVDEARAIHLGDAEARSIHGQATPAQAEQLADEGIAVMPLPFPVLPREAQN